MKFIKNNKIIRYVLPVFLFSFCIVWIVRLEIKAAAMASRVDEHHQSLKNNKDVLDFLDQFERGVKNQSILLDGTMIELRSYLTAMGLTDKGVTLQLGDSWFYLDDKGVALSRGKNNESLLTVTDKGIKIKVGSGNEFFINASESDGNINITKGDSKIFVGKASLASSSGSNTVEGVVLGEVNTGTVAVAKGKGIGIKTKDNNDIILQAGKDFYVKFLPKQDYLLIKNGDSEFQIGKTQFGEGIAMGEFNTGTYAVNKGKGLAMKATGKNEVRISGEDKLFIKFDGEIDIRAKNNVKITSDNGDVIINGKKVRVNE